MSLPEAIALAADLIGGSKRLAVLTGSGISQESGVPTFRDAQTGLWARYDPQQLATQEAFRRDPKLVWDWYEYRRQMVRQAEPNPGHRALADLEALLPQVAVITQNVDDLHQRAGSSDIIPLHGAILRSKCFADCRGAPTIIDAAALPDHDPQAGPPRCPYCGGWVRPDVVWFGETLSRELLDRALMAAESADVMLVVGTSGVVQPAASLPFVAKQHGAHIVEVNPTPGMITSIADLWLGGPAGVILPQIVAAIRARR